MLKGSSGLLPNMLLKAEPTLDQTRLLGALSSWRLKNSWDREGLYNLPKHTMPLPHCPQWEKMSPSIQAKSHFNLFLLSTTMHHCHNALFK